MHLCLRRDAKRSTVRGVALADKRVRSHTQVTCANQVVPQRHLHQRRRKGPSSSRDAKGCARWWPGASFVASRICSVAGPLQQPGPFAGANIIIAERRRGGPHRVPPRVVRVNARPQKSVHRNKGTYSRCCGAHVTLFASESLGILVTLRHTRIRSVYTVTASNSRGGTGTLHNHVLRHASCPLPPAPAA